MTVDTRPCDFLSCNQKSQGPRNEATLSEYNIQIAVNSEVL